MSSKFKTISTLTLAFGLMMSLSACLPKKGGANGGVGSTARSDSDLFSTTGVRTGSSGVPGTDSSGYYYSRDPLYTITGACRGSVAKVLIEVTPQSQATTQETIDCSSNFTWNKTFSSENTYAVKMTPLSSNSSAVSGVSPITKYLVYDTTAPAAATFLTPTTANTYTISDGSTQVTITGQVLNEVNYLISPTGERITLTPNPDHLHQDYSFTVTVPQNATTAFTFTSSDYAGNAGTTTMTIQSTVSLQVPIAANELGGSQAFDGVYIQSTINLYQGAVVNDHVQLSTGSSGIVGDMQ